MRQRDQVDRDLVQAWHVTYVWLRTQHEKRMPSLKQLLAHGKTARPTRDQQLALYEHYSQLYGLTLRKVPA